MPVDASIPLQSKVPETLADPIGTYSRALQLQSQLGGQQLQAAQITGANQENQMRQNSLNSQKAIQQALIESKGDPDAWGPLAAKYGAMPQDVMAIQEKQATIRKTFADATKAETDAHKSLMDQGAGLVNAAITATDPQSKQAAWDSATAFAKRNNIGAGQVPATYPGDDQAKAYLGSMQLYSGALDQRKVEAAEKAAQGGADRGKAALQNSDRLATAADAKTWSAKLGATTNANDYKAVYDQIPTGIARTINADPPEKYTPQSGQKALYSGMTPAEITADMRTKANQQAEQGFRQASLGQGAARLKQGEFAQAQHDFEANAAGEEKAAALKANLQSALADGQTYIDQTGQQRPFSSMKTQDGAALTDADKAALRQEMQTRVQAANAQLQNFVTNKNNALIRSGQNPQFTTQQVMAAYKAGDAAPAQPAAAPAAAPKAAPAAAPAPAAKGKPIDAASAQQILRQAGGDPAKARQLAIQKGYDPKSF